MLLALVVGVGVLVAPPASTNAAFTASTTAAGSVSTATFFRCTSAVQARPGDVVLAFDLVGDEGSRAVDSSPSGRDGEYLAPVLHDTTDDGACPRDPPGAAVFDGRDSTLVSAAVEAPTTFSIEVWFRTTAGTGRLLGFGNSRTGYSSEYDRHLYFSSTGQLTFGVWTGSRRTVTTPERYADGAWHHAVATASPTDGSVLYVDGVRRAADPDMVPLPSATEGYWRLGFDSLDNWPRSASTAYDPSSPYHFAGSARNAVVWSTVLDAEQVAAAHRAGR